MKNKFKFLALAIMALLSVNVWGADPSIIFKATDLGGTNNKYELKSGSAGGVSYSSYSYTNTGSYQVNGNKGKNIFFNTSQMPGAIKSIKATKASGTDRSVTAYVSTTALTSSNYSTNGTSLGAKNVTSSGTTWTLTSDQIAAGYKYFYLHYSTTSALYVSQFEVTYAAAATPVTSLDLYVAGQRSDLKSGKKVGDKYTLPTPAEVTAECGDKVLVGWSTSEIPSPTTKPTTGFYAPGAEVTLVANNTFYAVFADASSGGGSTTETLTVGTNGGATWTNSVLTESATVGNVLFTALHSNGNSGKYYSTDNSWRFYSDDDGLTISTKDGSNITQVVITWKTGAPKTPTNWSKSGNSSPYTYTTTTNTNSVTFLRNGTNVLFQVIAVTYSGGTSYSNYTTTCVSCTAISPTLSYTATATVGQVLNPTLDKKGSSGAVTYSIKSGGSYASINASTGALTCSATGTVTVQATIAAAGDYCDGTATSNAITISEPSYTITATKNDASLGNVSLSGKVITATPNTCVGYANPAYTVAPDGKATVNQSGNIFTVSNVTADVTVTINFAELAKDTYEDHLHGNTAFEECGSYEAPSLPDAAKATTEDCDVLHYHFAGWVTSTITTGTPGVPSGMITAGTAMNANGRTYIAVWAKEE